MTFDLHLQIDSHSPEGHALAAIINRDCISPEEAIRRLLKQTDALDPDNCEHLFTPEVIADLRSVASEMETGGLGYSSEQIREHFDEKRKTSLASHPS